MKRKHYKFKNAKQYIDNVLSSAKKVGFKRTETVCRSSTDQSHYKNNISEFEYINTKEIFKNKELFNDIEQLSSKINLENVVLVEYLLNFKKNDFLDWMECEYWETNTIGKFLSFALTDGNTIEFKNGDDNEIVKVPKYSAIEFNTADVHRVKKVNKEHTWLVLMVPDHLNLDIIFKDIT